MTKQSKKITNPIIIFGNARSGTTILFQMLSRHSQLAWMSQLANRYPDKPIFNRVLMKALDFPQLSRLIRKRINAAESYNFWDYHCKGFSIACRDLLATDVSRKTKKRVQQAIGELTTNTRTRPALKITGWPRLGFFSEIFEDAKFIHVIRDGRAVANSLVNVRFWRGWGGPEKWLWGPLSAEHQATWEKYNRSFIVLAAIQWEILMSAAEAAKKHIDENNYMEIRYEELCVNPISEIGKIVDFTDLTWTDRFENELRNYQLKNTNQKWQDELNTYQQNALHETLKDALSKYGYL